MSYNLSHHSHDEIVNIAFEKWTNSHPDMFLMSSDGEKIYTQRILIQFYSPLLSDMLEADLKEEVGISVPATTNTLVNLMKVLTTGFAVTKLREDLDEIANIANMIGIDFENWQIGAKRKKAKYLASGHKEGVEKEVKLSQKTGLDKVPIIKTEKEMDDEKIPTTKNTNLDLEKALSSLHKKSSTCNFCGKICERKDKLKIHIGSHFKLRTRNCQDCGLSFKNQEQMDDHFPLVHHKINRNTSHQDDTSKSVADFLKERPIELPNILSALDKNSKECILCGYNKVPPSKLKKHVMIHFRSHTHNCQECGLSFKNQQQMDNHFPLVHDGETSVKSVVNPFQQDLEMEEIAEDGNDSDSQEENSFNEETETEDGEVGGDGDEHELSEEIRDEEFMI